jgi:phosphoadenosine phosphosulfate reductase
MPLIDHTLFGIVDKVQIAIDRIRQFEPPEGYYVAFSGGKDSQVVLSLVKESGCKHDTHMNATTVDPPEVIHFVRKHYPEVLVHQPDKSMWQLIVEKRMPPTRMVKYCCGELKERGGKDRLVVTGIRWEESARRKKRTMVEQCRNVIGKRFLHPIIDWTVEDVWEYHKAMGLPYLDLYDTMDRVGCICCPTVGAAKMMRDAERWPKFAEAYKRAMQRCIDKRKADGLPTEWNTGEDMWRWWLGLQPKVDEDQFTIFE